MAEIVTIAELRRRRQVQAEREAAEQRRRERRERDSLDALLGPAGYWSPDGAA